ncbi:OLC1v1026612C1 [Oldenlandia corymbosa var. corymbosa]|uniref:OLC1v1026612C1 n=1 Tax=Oldenlandia corymbosa var. corymbosa TaxID=529605 RepID=A0AAV1C873_OLDCO|nr:OLC1v1026612C1 [Oldenlandia corymbosa var. corymbosa]
MSAQLRKLVSSTEIKLDGKLIHEILTHKPYCMTSTSPKFIQGVELLDDREWGKVGSVRLWKFISQDGKTSVAKDIIEAVDDANKSVTFRMIEGDILMVYNTFAITYNFDKVGGSNLVTCTFEYEKKDDNIPDPHSFMDVCLNGIKDIEAYHLN